MISEFPSPEGAQCFRVFGAPDLPESHEPAVLLIDKPAGWSSFDIIRKLRRVIGVRKIGHAGTLDPMATGLVICLTGRATKLVDRFMGMPKVYEAVIRLGQSTASYDAETEVIEECRWDHVSNEAIQDAIERLTGHIEQLPPMYSAVKVGGERLYKKARRGEVIERAPRNVVVHAFDVLRQEGPDVFARIHCSKGTYIRSLAHDLGAILGTGAHLTALRRTAIGDYQVTDAWEMKAVEQASLSADPGSVARSGSEDPS